jgi:hypothetical protein
VCGANWYRDQQLLLNQKYGVVLASCSPLYLDALRKKRINRPASIIGLDGNLSGETSIDQGDELYQSGSAKVEQSIHCCANCPTGVKHIIDQYYRSSFYWEREMGCGWKMEASLVEIIPIEGGIERAVMNIRVPHNLLQNGKQPLRKGNSSGLNTDQNRVPEITMNLYQLVCQSLQHNSKLAMVEEGFQGQVFW